MSGVSRAVDTQTIVVTSQEMPDIANALSRHSDLLRETVAPDAAHRARLLDGIAQQLDRLYIQANIRDFFAVRVELRTED